MFDHQDLEKLKSLKPNNDIFNHIGVFLTWQKAVLPLLAFSTSLYNKFQEQTKHVVNATMDFRTEDCGLHIKIMIGVYNEAVPQLEKLIKKQIFKKRFPIINFLLLEWRPLLQVPVAIFVVLATLLITRYFSVNAPSPNNTTQHKPEKNYVNTSSQTGKANIRNIPHSSSLPPDHVTKPNQGTSLPEKTYRTEPGKQASSASPRVKPVNVHDVITNPGTPSETLSKNSNLLITGSTDDENNAIKLALKNNNADSIIINITRSPRDNGRIVQITVGYKGTSPETESFNTPLENASSLIISSVSNIENKRRAR